MRRAALVVAGVLVVLNAPLGTATANAATQQVMMQDYAFSPAALTVHVGDTVTWTQHDQAPHDATTTSAPAAFHSPQLSPGQSWSHTFQTAGTYSYYCSVHPDMRATVTVLAAATTAPPQPAPTRRTTPSRTVPRTTAAGVNDPAPTQPTTAAPAGTETAEPQQIPAQAVAPQTTASATATLDPMLLLAGVVTAIAVLCLLLLGSRSAS